MTYVYKQVFKYSTFLFLVFLSSNLSGIQVNSFDNEIVETINLSASKAATKRHTPSFL